jgi:hypothetical protein
MLGRGIPVLVDAASEHIERPNPYLARGADMVIYSGGKFLRGPQTSGLLLGKRALVEAAWRNASPHQAFARGMKVSKEDVIGVLAALEVWFEQRDPAAELRRWTADLEVIRKQLDLPGVRAAIVPPHGVVRVPLLTVEWDALPGRPDGPTVRARLLENDPRVMIDDMTLKANALGIDPFGLQQGEAVQVAHALRAALTDTVATAPAATAPPRADLSGLWDVTVSFLQGERTHRMELTQQDGRVAGSQHSPQFDGPVAGSLHGDDVHLTFRMRYEGTDIVYRLDGSVADGTMRGTVTLGSATDHHKGEVNLAQFGTGRFQAERRAACTW